MASPASTLPPFAPFLTTELRAQVQPDEWSACTAAWASLAEAHLALPDAEFAKRSLTDDSIPAFLSAFSEEVGSAGPAILGAATGVQVPLRRVVFDLTKRMLLHPATARSVAPAVQPLLQWEFLADLCRVHSKGPVLDLLVALPATHRAALDASLAALKKSLIQDLDAGLANPPQKLRELEGKLDKLNFLLARFPPAGVFFLAGSDFLDGLISCFRPTNPPLRRVLVATTYLCVVGLADAGSGPAAGPNGSYGPLTDQLYALKAAADAHRAGPTRADDSLVAELVTSTPLVGHLERQLGKNESAPAASRAKAVLKELATFRKPGVGLRQPARRVMRKKVDKGKGVAVDLGVPSNEMHIHRMQQITQVQDLFPDLGSAFIAKLLDEYKEDQEQVVAHLLDDSLPDHLQSADRTEELASNTGHRQSSIPKSIAPRPTPPLRPAQVPTRHNIFDNDELDSLTVDAAKLHLGKQNPGRTADDILNDRSGAPNKTAILSALAAFDLDDDERDDTYDAEDVGGTVDAAGGAEDDVGGGANEEALYKAWQSDPATFAREPAARKGPARARLRMETGMTDEAVEGWGLMLSRDPKQQRKLEARYAFTGAQVELESTAWRASPAGSGAEDSEGGSGSGSYRGGRGRGRGRGRGGAGGGGRGGGNVAGPTGEKETEQARRRKEANKSSRANHNRRDQRARKMARGGLPG